MSSVTFAKYKLYRMPGNLTGCVYCGAPADTKDHVSPQSLHRLLDSFNEQTLADDIQGVLVPACRECNSMLGPHPAWMLSERIDALKKLFWKKHKRAIRRALWSDDEISECGRGLGSYIASMNAKDASLRERYEFSPPADFVQEVEIEQLSLDLRARKAERPV